MPEYRTKVIVDLSTFSSPRFRGSLGENRARIFFGEKVSVGILTLGKTYITLHHLKGISFQPITLSRSDVARVDVERQRILRRSIVQIVTADGSAIIVMARGMKPELLDAFDALSREGQRSHLVPPRLADKVPNPVLRRMSPLETIWPLSHLVALTFVLGITIAGKWGPVALALSVLLIAGLSWPLSRIMRRSPRRQERG